MTVTFFSAVVEQYLLNHAFMVLVPVVECIKSKVILPFLDIVYLYLVYVAGSLSLVNVIFLPSNLAFVRVVSAGICM